MLQSITRKALVAACFLAGPYARAGVLQSTPSLPATSGVFNIQAMSCLLAGCILESNIDSLVRTSSDFVGGNQLVTATGVLTASVFQNNGGVPGAPIGTLELAGTLSFTYLGRSSDIQLGTFISLLTAFDFVGSFNGHTLHSQLNPVPGGNTGITSVSRPLGVREFLVDSFFDVFAEVSLDGAPFVPQPERTVTFESAVPEAGSAGLTLTGLGALAWITRRLKASRT
jgi:hypothetical protein